MSSFIVFSNYWKHMCAACMSVLTNISICQVPYPWILSAQTTDEILNFSAFGKTLKCGFAFEKKRDRKRVMNLVINSPMWTNLHMSNVSIFSFRMTVHYSGGMRRPEPGRWKTRRERTLHIPDKNSDVSSRLVQDTKDVY